MVEWAAEKMGFDHANSIMNLYAAEIILVLVATVVILAVCLVRERLTTERRLKDMYDRIQSRHFALNKESESSRGDHQQSGHAPDQPAAKPSVTMDENIVAAARVGFADLHGRMVTLESRADAMDLLLIGLLKNLIKSQPFLQASSPSEKPGQPAQEVEYELEAMRRPNSTRADVAAAKGQSREKAAPAEAGFSPEEYKIGNLLRRLATFDEVLLKKPR
jgi:hypothetical protein